MFLSMLVCPGWHWFIITFSFMTPLALHGSYILISKCRIPLRTLIFMPYDSQGMSIIDPVTGSSSYSSIIYFLSFAIINHWDVSSLRHLTCIAFHSLISSKDKFYPQLSPIKYYSRIIFCLIQWSSTRTFETIHIMMAFSDI